MNDAHARLHSFIVSHYSLEEFQTLCFALAVPYDDLLGKGLSGQARELILYMGRQERLADLADQLKKDHPVLF
ncbi:MAG: hypothetical protein JSW55_14685, partial [Chloroflexota bacterium]